ncbi:MAG: amidohydrolase family protein [Bryobacteraceae bacterium]|nr:amidohydrolase family protein [Bryobacteraceae bacterium]
MTRRVMLAAVSGGSLLGKAAQPSSKVSFPVPAHACDCHTHIFGEYPLFAGRSYTPEHALPAEMSALHRALGIERVVIVTPSIYGTDNAATLAGMKARGKSARGVAVIDERTSEAELDQMHQAGMRGIRLNLNNGPRSGLSPRERFTQAAQWMGKRGWHIQMFVSPVVISNLRDLVSQSPVPAVFDHFGGASFAAGAEQPGFSDLVDLVSAGKAYVKLSVSGPNIGLPSEGADPLAKALIAANPDRVLWGTDWPHPDAASGRPATEVSPLKQVDDGAALSQLARWAPDAATRKKILVDNPARLYKF